ncbi:MAG: sugar phosphate nucleotidyltransferase [Desulfobacterota bacterium]|nr:sugar phosphate nucleotidyltransferase [Thermodesulfobacteriota bacterium]
MSHQNIMGVILAGGKGSRMYPFSEHYPKAILPICNKPLMEHQIEMMKAVGIESIIVVIGHYGFDVVRVMGNGERYGITLHYVDQGQTLGIAHALSKLENLIDRPFMLFLGDIFFVTDSLQPMIDEFFDSGVNAVLATKIEPDVNAIKRNFSVLMDEKGFVRRVIEKPRHPVNNLKGCGLYLFDLHIFDAVRRTPRTASRDEYEITDSIQILIDDGFKVKSKTIIQEDLNLTYPEDLLMINLIELRRRNLPCLIGSNTSLSPDRVENSVIGDNVVCPAAIMIKNSVVFSNTTINEGTDLEQAIVTPDRIIYCSKSAVNGYGEEQ